MRNIVILYCLIILSIGLSSATKFTNCDSGHSVYAGQSFNCFDKFVKPINVAGCGSYAVNNGGNLISAWQVIPASQCGGTAWVNFQCCDLVSNCSDSQTVVNGKIYDDDYSSVISNATVIVECNNIVLNTTTSNLGNYVVYFNECDCDDGSSVLVNAYKGARSGMNSGIVENNMIGNLDLSIINVILVPEFGFIIGFLTLASGICIFYFVRR